MLSQVAVVILVEHARLRRERSHGLNISQRTSFCVFFFVTKITTIHSFFGTGWTPGKASNTVIDDVTNWIMHRIFNANRPYSVASPTTKFECENYMVS